MLVSMQERGQGMVEYALILVLVAVLVIGVLTIMGSIFISSCIWASFTVIQFIGNYSEHWDADWLFFATWVFTYMVGIAAGTWAAYGWIGIENVWIHWLCAIGLGGSAELIPERLLAMFVKSLQAKTSKPIWSTNTQNQSKQNRPWEQPSKQKSVINDFANSHKNDYRPDPFMPLSGAKKLKNLVEDREEWSN